MPKNQTPRDYFESYVSRIGGARALSKRSKIPYFTICHILNGQRGIGRQTAKALKKFDPALDLGRLLLVEPTLER
jgi:hypothetical protein